MKRIYQEPILEVSEVVVESGFVVSAINWVEGGPGGNFDVDDYGYEL